MPRDEASAFRQSPIGFLRNEDTNGVHEPV